MDDDRKLTPIKLDEYKPLRDVVFEPWEAIDGKLKPGERLMEVQLAGGYGCEQDAHP